MDCHVGFTVLAVLVLPSWFFRVGLWVVDREFVSREFVGCALWC